MSIPASNPQTYGWIKTALNQSIEHAMDSLVQFDSSGDDATPLSVVAEHLHQIQGSLQMVELEAASLYANELEALTGRLSADQLNGQSDSAVDNIRQGLELLSNYLSAIENQSPQSPLVLLKNINKVRQLNGRNELSDYDLFDPSLQLDGIAEPIATVKFPEEKRKNLILQLRKRYRQALLSWLNQRNSKQSLETLVELMTSLRKVSGLGVQQQLWWVAAGFIESIQFGGISPNPDVKAQFAKLDIEMSRMRDDNRASIASSPPDELLRQMLFYIGKVTNEFGHGDMPRRVGKIKKALGLEQWFDFDANTMKFGKLNDVIDAIGKFSSALDESLLRQIENNVDLYFSAEMDEEQKLHFFTQLETLRSIAMENNVEYLSGFISSLCDAIIKVENSQESLAQTGADIKIASSVLLLKDTLQNPQTVSETWQQSINQHKLELISLLEFDHGDHSIAILDDQQSATEYSDARAVIFSSIGEFLGKIELLLTKEGRDEGKSEETQDDSVLATSIIDNLSEVSRLLEFLEINHLQQLSFDTAQLVQHHKESLDIANRGRLAFVIASIGSGVEQFQQTGQFSNEIIVRANEMLNTIMQSSNNIIVANAVTQYEDAIEQPDDVSVKPEDTDQPAVELGPESADQVCVPEAETGTFFDDALREIFIDELSEHSQTLIAIEQMLSSDSVFEDQQNESLNAHFDSLNLVFHTLTGNFKNMGYEALGSSFSRLEAFDKPSVFDADTQSGYCQWIKSVAGNLDSLVLEIKDKNSISQMLEYELMLIPRQFKQIQLQKTKSAIPFETDNIIDSASEDVESDYSIFDLDEEFEINEIEILEESDGEVLEQEEEAQNTSEELKDHRESPVVLEEDIDPEIRQIFIEESESMLGRINLGLTEWRKSGKTDDVLGGIRREFHTLKGSAAVTGFIDVSNLSHLVESLLQRDDLYLEDDDGGLISLLEEIHDGLAAELGFIPGGTEGHVKTLISMAEVLLSDELAIGQSIEQLAETGQEFEESKSANQSIDQPIDQPIDRANTDALTANQSIEDVTALIQGQYASTQDQDQVQAEQHSELEADSVEIPKQSVSVTESVEIAAGSLRIENRKLSDLLNFSGELGLTRTQLKNILNDTRSELDILRSSMRQIRHGLRDLESEADAQMRSLPEGRDQATDDESFDPLQLDRYSRLQARARDVNQQLDTLIRTERQLSDRASDLDSALIQQLHLGERLQDGLMSARMVSINDYIPRMRQLVRETGRRTEKSIGFSVQGDAIEVDRQVMDAMMPAFEHMIRNSIVHGIEDEERRIAGKKLAQGNIHLDIAQKGSELLVEFMDDGQGLNRDKLIDQAIENGFITGKEDVNDEHLLQVIVQPGYSTAESVTLDSGRGVGMDVVYQAVRSLGGSMAVTSVPGVNTRFQFRLPVTMTISQALLVNIGAYRFSILTRTIERVMRVHEEEIQRVGDQGYVTLNDSQVPIINLAQRMGVSSLSTADAYKSLVIVRLADRISAFEVDQFEETVEIVTKTPGTQLTSIDGVIGVTVLADTSIVLILDPGQFLDRAVLQGEAIAVAAPVNTISAPQVVIEDIKVSDSLHRVLVVDDSLVVRKVMQRDIESIGLDVVSAVDGVNALEVLEESSDIDIALIDLEMPRMNGYKLLVKLRQDARFVNLPIIIITSRSGELHRERAIGLGADNYITKPYNLQQLKQMMEQLVVNKAAKH